MGGDVNGVRRGHRGHRRSGCRVRTGDGPRPPDRRDVQHLTIGGSQPWPRQCDHLGAACSGRRRAQPEGGRGCDVHRATRQRGEQRPGNRLQRRRRDQHDRAARRSRGAVGANTCASSAAAALPADAAAARSSTAGELADASRWTAKASASAAPATAVASPSSQSRHRRWLECDREQPVVQPHQLDEHGRPELDRICSRPGVGRPAPPTVSRSRAGSAHGPGPRGIDPRVLVPRRLPGQPRLLGVGSGPAQLGERLGQLVPAWRLHRPES